MTNPAPRGPLYPKSHILAASGVAALLSLALLVFPTREVEAKKTYLDLEMDSSLQSPLQASDELSQSPEQNAESPFADVPQTAASEETETSANAAAENSGTRSIVVSSGDTLSTLFAKVGLSVAFMHQLLEGSKDARQFSQLKVGQQLDFELTPDGELQRLSTNDGQLVTLSLARQDDGSYRFQRDEATPVVRNSYAHGVIDSSLFLAAKRAGLSHNLTMELANVFGYDIDFARQIREGDEFEVIYEDKYHAGDRVGTGNILAARFTNAGKTYTAVRYTSKQGVTNYYTANGDSMRRAFIRTPVEFSRISSRFSMGRRHPVLNKIRAHKGVDYAAPTGTPIKAAGDGRIVEAGRKGGYGNAVVIKHGQRYTTLYGHMSRIANGIRAGVPVEQGQIIGYVGMTGLATGPHLHYEFRINGQHVDPLGVKLPMADPIAASEKKRFMQISQPLMARLDQEKATLVALNGKR